MITKEKRSDRIYIMVSPREKKMLEFGAEVLGYTTLSDFIRETAKQSITSEVRGKRAA